MRGIHAGGQAGRRTGGGGGGQCVALYVGARGDVSRHGDRTIEYRVPTNGGATAAGRHFAQSTTFAPPPGWHLPPEPEKGSPYSITERRVSELIPDLGSQPAGDVSHKPGGRLPILSARPAVTLATLKRADTSFAAW